MRYLYETIIHLKVNHIMYVVFPVEIKSIIYMNQDDIRLL